MSLISAEKLLTVDGFWGNDISFSLWAWYLVGHPFSNGWSYTHDFMGSTNYTVFSEDMISGGAKGWKVDIRGVSRRSGDNYDQNTLYAYTKFSIKYYF